eukprot:1739962-Prymnesium_polylepis.1
MYHLVPEAPPSRVALEYRLTAHHRPYGYRRALRKLGAGAHAPFLKVSSSILSSFQGKIDPKPPIS